MDKMKELYKKVASDSKLQEKISQILNNAEKVDAEITEEKLKNFAKEAGYEVEVADMQQFIKENILEKQGELSDTELDAVAGGKLDGSAIGCSICSLGFSCALASTVSAIVKGSCGQYFQES